MRKLRLRLILLVLIAVLPMVGMAVFSGLEQRRLARKNAVDDAFLYTRLVTGYSTSLINITKQRLLSLTLSADIADPAACVSYLSRWQQINPVYTDISINTPDGKEVCSSTGSTRPTKIGSQNYFQEVVRTRIATVGAPYNDIQSQKTVLPISVPVMDGGQNLSRVVTTWIDLRQLLDYVATINLPAASAVLLVDPNGTVLLRYPDTEAWSGRNLSNIPIIQQILNSRREGSTQASGVDGVTRLYAFTPFKSNISSDYFISVGIPASTAFAGVNLILSQNLIWIGLAFLAVFAAAWFAGDFFFLRVVSLTAERDAAEQKLRESNAELESHVQQRTAELAQVNDQLKIELAERQRTLQILRKREVELNRLLTLLERSNQDLQDFAFIASHDLQEPLRKIQAFGQRLVQRHGGQLDEEGNMFATRMITSASRMQEMIEALLAYSRVSTRGHAFEQVDLNTTMRDVLSNLEVRIQKSGGQVHVGNLPVIQADSIQMVQLLQNLVVNALKFHRPDVSPVVDVSAEVKNGENGSVPEAVITVRDNGIGFENQYLERIFQPFQRLYSKDTYEGSGIGLAVCRKIVSRHNGKITATSEPGQGSCFVITIPTQNIEKDEKNEI